MSFRYKHLSAQEGSNYVSDRDLQKLLHLIYIQCRESDLPFGSAIGIQTEAVGIIRSADM